MNTDQGGGGTRKSTGHCSTARWFPHRGRGQKAESGKRGVAGRFFVVGDLGSDFCAENSSKPEVQAKGKGTEMLAILASLRKENPNVRKRGRGYFASRFEGVCLHFGSWTFFYKGCFLRGLFSRLLAAVVFWRGRRFFYGAGWTVALAAICFRPTSARAKISSSASGFLRW